MPAAAAGAAAAPVAPQVPSQLAGKTVDDIIKGWRDQLETHAQAFVSQAALLQRWDAAVLSNRQVRAAP
jgi:nuclear pore complex protein Nup62